MKPVPHLPFAVVLASATALSLIPPLLIRGQEPASTLTGLPPSKPIEENRKAVFSDNDLAEPTEPFSNFRLHLAYDLEGEARIKFHHPEGVAEVALPAGKTQVVDLAWEHIPNQAARLRSWRPGDLEPIMTDIEDSLISSGGLVLDPKQTREHFDLSGDFTLMVRFQAKGDGTLAALAPAKGKWQPNGKSLFLRGGKLVYDIGWVGDLRGKHRVNDGKPHLAVLVVQDGTARLLVDGREEAVKKGFTSKDDPNHVFKIGTTATNFGGDLEDGEIANVQFWKRALEGDELKKLAGGMDREVNTPDFHWKAGGDAGTELTGFGSIEGYPATISLASDGSLEIREAWVQPLEKSDHQEIVATWDAASLERGGKIYQTLCITCHGTSTQEGSIPLALKFHEGEYKNGNDPYRMWQTISRGYGLMMPQPQYTTRQVYDVMHYIREALVHPTNPGQHFELDEAYIASLPRGMTLVKEKEGARRPPQYELMDFGDYLFWTYQVEPGPLEPGVNLAYKALAIRLDSGPGGISKGKAWAVYDLDTMRLATVFTGDQFVDWKGIAFDGSHGTHTSLVGERLLTTPNAPGWAHPESGTWEDPRLVGKDGRKFGPLPRAWAHFKGIEINESGITLKYTVGDVEIRETPSYTGDGFVRLIETSERVRPLAIRVSGEQTLVIDPGDEGIAIDLAGQSRPIDSVIGKTPPQPTPASRFSGLTTTTLQRGADDGPFAVDILTVPDADLNPWQSWMRLSGIDFFEDGKRAAVCTWMGDVWIVSGIDREEGDLTWRRICAGLFQPLGLRIVDGEIYVACRDMIARLEDRDGDGETDEIVSFNNDHQVTEHFHEFAMGLQTDDEGNFYYAKSARHAKTALVPHHGTLLRVTPDGSRTDILASGFRAANGVCLNPDGTFIVTDQEGHWNPKNRINWVRGKGQQEFFGNIYGYTPVTDQSDDAMEKPLCWITNAFDRSPSELLWVPESASWGPLNGSLLNLSYGYGKIYVVPHEFVGDQVQGGMCQLPIAQFPTGVMRGRFHPGDGQFYGCGMFAWGSNQRQAGGFYRVRYTGQPALLPTHLAAIDKTVSVTFSDPIDPEIAKDPDSYAIRAWDLKRSANYGSKHLNERSLEITGARLSDDGKTVELQIPGLQPTRGMEIRCKVKSASADHEPVERIIHNSIHQLP